MSMTIFLNRHTGFNRSCRVRFNMRVAEGIESGIRDEVSDQDGKSLGKFRSINLRVYLFPDQILYRKSMKNCSANALTVIKEQNHVKSVCSKINPFFCRANDYIL